MDAIHLNAESVSGGVFLLTGEDGYLLKKAERFFRSLVPEGALSLYVIDYLSDVNQLASCIGVYNFDGTPNVVIVRDDFKFDEAQHAKLATLLSGQIAPDYLVFTRPGNLTNAEKKKMISVDCKKPDRYTCASYAEKLFPYGIEKKAVALLCDFAECDLGKINKEAEKLLAYCETRAVTVADVENLVPEDRDVKFYAFSQSLIEKDRQTALRLLERMRVYGESNAAILASLSTQFQRMLFCSLSPLSDEELAEKMKIQPFIVTKARRIKGYGKGKLRSTLAMLLNVEHQFKSGVMSDATALNLAVAKLLE